MHIIINITNIININKFAIVKFCAASFVADYFQTIIFNYLKLPLVRINTFSTFYDRFIKLVHLAINY